MAPINKDPENTPEVLYLLSGTSKSIADLLSEVKNHFGADVNLDDLLIESEYIHTRCLTYDLFDPTDYDDYLVVTLKKKTLDDSSVSAIKKSFLPFHS